MSRDDGLAYNVRTYLSRANWSEQAPGSAGSLWQHKGRDNQIVTIAVPTAIAPGSVEWRSVVERLAAFEQRSFEDMAFRLRNLFIDIVRFRAANDKVIRGSIPLTAGVSLVQAAYKMFRATATTSRGPRAHIAAT